MSASDILFDASLPHGTKEGYAVGCRGSHCPGVEWFGISCERAHMRYSSDYNYRKRIDAGMPAADIAAADAIDVEEARAREAAEKVVTDRHGNVRLKKPTVFFAASRSPIAEPVERRRPGRPAGHRKPLVHGTRAGYRRGCRDDCPGGESGMTCRQANAAEQRASWARKAEQS